MTSSISQPVLYPKLPDHPEYYTSQEAYELGHDHGVESRDTQFAELVATIAAVKALYEKRCEETVTGWTVGEESFLADLDEVLSSESQP